MYQSESYPNAAYILSIIGAIFIILAGIFLGLVGAVLTFFLAGVGAIGGLLGIVWGIIILVGAINLRSNPSQHVTWGVIILVFSLISWWGAAGGFFIGFLLAFIGGIMAIVWVPPRHSAQPAYAPAPPPTAPSAPATSQNVKYCSNCGAQVALDAKYCPHCGKEVT
jgi:ribosomal protein L40E